MMFTEQVLVALLASAQLTTGAALSGLTSFSVQQQESKELRFRHGFVEMEAAFEKFGVTVPDHIRSAAEAAKKQKGSVSATPENFDKAYISPVQIGSPAQTLELDFDTGSSDLWVFGSKLPRHQKQGHAVYNPKKSKTGKLMDGATWKISYGDGSGAQGIVYADQVAIGPVTATTQAVEAATSISPSFAKSRIQDGLVGLAFSSINTVSPNKQTTFWDTVKGTLAKQVFAANLQKGKPGKYDFGFIDINKFFGKLDYANVDNSQGFWSFTADGYSVGPSQSNNSFSAIADTGTSLAYIPAGAASDYYSTVQGSQQTQGAYIFPCSADLPNFSVIVGGKKHVIPGNYINYAPLGGGQCFGGLQPNTGLPFSILGDVFLKSQYVVFDFGKTRIGFGNAK